jgi:stearoyl-CoA desaturase (delta-9 desaturase)
MLPSRLRKLFMNSKNPARSFFKGLKSWFISSSNETVAMDGDPERIDWTRGVPYIAIQLAPLAIIWTGWSWLAVVMAVFLFALRVFTLTGFYHRYFSHRAFKVGRLTQFVFGWIGCTSIQKGPLWWAAHHRHHHTHSDDEEDIHSPKHKGFWFAHMGWFLTPRSVPTNYRMIPDFAKYPELRWLDRFDLVPPVILIALLYVFGLVCSYQWPELGCTGMQMVAWFFLSTVAVYHVTYLVNTATHLYGTRRYKTKDDSRNSLLIALLTFGEGWHNNHHYYPNSTRQGFFWWEIDITYYGILLLKQFGLVWDIRGVPHRIKYPQPKVEIPVVARPATQES